MTYRVFEDPRGRRWQVWQVSPSYSERRKNDRRTGLDRRARTRASSVDRRARPDRRVKSLRRYLGVPQMASGWLCFESNGEKRRLIPVPLNWENADERALAAFCDSATAR
jgi:hypothetical protein